MRNPRSRMGKIEEWGFYLHCERVSVGQKADMIRVMKERDESKYAGEPGQYWPRFMWHS